MQTPKTKMLHLSRDRLTYSFHFLCENKHLVWVPCAAVSLTTSKYLLVDASLHYPLHLQLLQHAAALLLLLLWRTFRSDEYSTGTEPLEDFQWASQLCVSFLLAVAGGCTMQAVLHLPNITLIAMLAPISLLVEQLITLTRTSSKTDRFNLYLCALLLVACGGILYGDYRLTVNGLLFSIPAFVLFGVVGALKRNEWSLWINNSPHWRPDILHCATGILAVGACAIYIEESTRVFESIQRVHLPWIIINLTASGIALALGKSVTVPSTTLERHLEWKSLLALAGLTGCLSTLILHRSYISVLQLAAYFLAGVSRLATIKEAPQSRFGLRKQSFLTTVTGYRRLGENGGDVPNKSSSFLSGSLNLLIPGFVSATWAIFLLLNFSSINDPHQLHLPVSQDTSFQPPYDTEIVVSMYHESLSTVSSLLSSLHSIPSLENARVHIYTKDPLANTTEIQEKLNVHNVTQLPNVGREGETYLHHILSQWDSLARHTVFLQADVHNRWETLGRIKQYFDPQRTGMLSLGFSGNICDCNRCEDRWGWRDQDHLLAQLYMQLNPKQGCDKILLSYKGQFIVSAKRIRGLDPSVYLQLEDALVNEDSWAHQEEFVRGRNDSMSAPVFGYTLERMWSTLFQCSDMEVAWKCASLLSGTRMGGDIGDCQCFDE